MVTDAVQRLFRNASNLNLRVEEAKKLFLSTPDSTAASVKSDDFAVWLGKTAT